MPTRKEWLQLYEDHISQSPKEGHPANQGERRKNMDGPCVGHGCLRCLICRMGAAIKLHDKRSTCTVGCHQIIPSSRVALELLVADALEAKEKKNAHP